ncbi:MAG: hypothetical protein IPK08_00665 [Bacteroidetes bacterium]|nr:hypothetical protein [Bacteroidota bacterium]
MNSGKPVTPSAILWMRLRKNIPAMAGLVIIVIAVFISLFAYLVMPDQSPNANDMNLSLSILPPGTTVQMIHVPVKVQLEEAGFLDKIFTGTPATFKSIPVDSVWLKNDTVYFIGFEVIQKILCWSKNMQLLKCILEPMTSGYKTENLNGPAIPEKNILLRKLKFPGNFLMTEFLPVSFFGY